MTSEYKKLPQRLLQAGLENSTLHSKTKTKDNETHVFVTRRRIKFKCRPEYKNALTIMSPALQIYKRINAWQ